MALIGAALSGGGTNWAACGDLAVAITCWRSLIGTLWRARFPGWGRWSPFNSFLGSPTWMALSAPDLRPSRRQVSGVAPTGRQSLGGLAISGCYLTWPLFGGGPNWTCFSCRFGGWPRLDLGRTCAGDTFQGPVLGAALIGPPHLGGGPDWIWQCWPSSGRLGATLTGHASLAACGVLTWTAPPWRSLTGAL